MVLLRYISRLMLLVKNHSMEQIIGGDRVCKWRKEVRLKLVKWESY